MWAGSSFRELVYLLSVRRAAKMPGEPVVLNCISGEWFLEEDKQTRARARCDEKLVTFLSDDCSICTRTNVRKNDSESHSSSSYHELIDALIESVQGALDKAYLCSESRKEHQDLTPSECRFSDRLCSSRHFHNVIFHPNLSHQDGEHKINYWNCAN